MAELSKEEKMRLVARGVRMVHCQEPQLAAAFFQMAGDDALQMAKTDKKAFWQAYLEVDRGRTPKLEGQFCSRCRKRKQKTLTCEEYPEEIPEKIMVGFCWKFEALPDETPEQPEGK